jgi:hypothetical protein
MARFEYSASVLGKDHPDFRLPWIRRLLSSEEVEEGPVFTHHAESHTVFFYRTLAHENGLRATYHFSRVRKYLDAAGPTREYCFLALCDPVSFVAGGIQWQEILGEGGGGGWRRQTIRDCEDVVYRSQAFSTAV